MSLNDLLTVIVHLADGEPLGDAMSRIRAWLDREKIETATFKTMAAAEGHVLAIGFRNASDAGRFRDQFAT